MIGDSVSKLFPGEGIRAARVDVEPPPGHPPMGQVKLWPIDCDCLEKEAKELKDRFAESFQ
jgi:hypothetical protein